MTELGKNSGLLLLSSVLLCDIVLWICCDGLSNFSVLCPHLWTISSQVSTGHLRGSLGSVAISLHQASPLCLSLGFLLPFWSRPDSHCCIRALPSCFSQSAHRVLILSRAMNLPICNPGGRTEKAGLPPGSLATAASNACAFLFVFFLSEMEEWTEMGHIYRESGLDLRQGMFSTTWRASRETTGR